MAERNVTVRLTAVTSAYDRALAQSGANTRQFATGSIGALDRHSAKIREVGGTLTKGLTLPLVGLGAVAVSASNDFDLVFSRMQGLAGVSADEVDGLKQSVMDLSGETTVAPQELAEALYFIRSAGLEGQDAMDALEFSAKGAAAGLGNAATVADAVTSAMNAYGPEVLNAARATDILAATAEVGKVEADQLAGQFGRLLPVASELGVTFDQVGGAMGFLTRTSGSADLAATQLNGVLSKMLEPGQEGRKVLEQLGMTTDDLRASISERGLLVTLEDLRGRLEGAGLEFSNFANDQQFIQGALMLTGENFEGASEAIGQVTDSVGKAENAFGAFAESQGFKNKQAMAQLQQALIDLGDSLAPIAADVAEFAGGVAEWFSGLDDGAKTAVLAFAGIAAALGPVLSFVGNLTRMGRGVITALEGIGTGLMKLGPAGTIAAGGLSAVAFGLFELWQQEERAEQRIRTMAEAINSMGDAGEGIAPTLQSIIDPKIISAMDAAGVSMVDLGSAMASNGPEWDRLMGRLAEGAQQAGINTIEWEILSNGLGNFRHEAQGAVELAGDLASTTEDTAASADLASQAWSTAGQAVVDWAADVVSAAAASDQHAESVERQRAGLEALADQVRGGLDPLFGMVDALDANAQAQADLLELQASGEATAEELADAQRNVTGTALDVTQAQLDLKKAVKDGSVSLADGKAQLLNWVDQGLITAETAAAMAGEFDTAAWKAGELNAVEDISIGVEARTEQAQANMVAFMVYTVGLQATASANGSTIGYNLAAGIASGIAAAQVIATAQAAATVYAIIGRAKEAAGITSPSKVMAREVGEPLVLGIRKGVLDTEGALGDALEAAIDRQLSRAVNAMSDAEARVGNVWDRITGRFSLDDARASLRQAENELERAGGGVNAARNAGQRDIDAARRARDRLTRSVNPWAWNAADKALQQAQNQTQRAVQRAKNEAERERRDAREAVEDAAFNLLQQSAGGLARRGRFGAIRNLADVAGFTNREENQLVRALRAENIARADLSAARGDAREQRSVVLTPEALRGIEQAVREGTPRVLVGTVNGQVLVELTRQANRGGQ